MNKFLVVWFIVVSCASNETHYIDNNVKSDSCFIYPVEVINLKQEDLYDSARWFIYTMHCDKPYLSKEDTFSKTYGELPLKFEHIKIMNDTVEIYFFFFANGEIVLPGMTRNFATLTTGVGFDIRTRKKIYMGTVGHYTVVALDTFSRYYNPLKPEVVSYLRNYKDEMDLCFKELALRKGFKF